MINDDPFYAPRRTIKETVEHIKSTLASLPKPMIPADWEILEGTRRIRHNPSGCLFEWTFKDHVWFGRQTRLKVVTLLDHPAHLDPQEVKQITGWASSAITMKLLTTPPRLGKPWDST